MNRVSFPRAVTTLTILTFALAMSAWARPAKGGASASPRAESGSAETLSSAALIKPAELAKILKSTTGGKPLILQIGFHMLYQQAHIPGAEYAGPASDANGRKMLTDRVKSLPHNKEIVLYCGCCPWSHCPNVQPAYALLHSMGFTNVKVLFLVNNFGTDWVYKGYPTVKGN